MSKELYNLNTPRSFSNKLIVEAYRPEGGLRSEIKNEFASVAQKNTLKGLKLLISAVLADDTYVPAGSIVYIKEELLVTQQWAKNILQSDTLKAQFISVVLNDVEYISPPPGDAA